MSTAAVANFSMSSASGEPPGWMTGSTYPGDYYVRPSTTVPNWNYWGNPSPYDQNPISPNPYSPQWPDIIWPAGTGIYRRAKTFMNCPHCGKNVEVKDEFTCSNCREYLYVAAPAPAMPPIQLPVIPVVWPVAAEPEKPKEPEKKHFFECDGSRWDDI